MSAMMQPEPRKSDTGVAHGMAGGIVAGIVFLSAEMVMSAMLGNAWFGPVRMISSIVLGTEALEPGYSFSAALLTGLIFHILLSAFFGLIFVRLVNFSDIPKSTGALVGYGFLYGTALWVINFWLIAPTFFPQFLQVNQVWNGFVAHSVFYGMVLGWYAASIRARHLLLHEEEPEVEKQRRFG